MKQPKYVTPKCCKEVQEYSTVFLQVPDSFCDGDTETPPKWVARCNHPEYDMQTTREVKGCPHCLTPVPEVVKRKTKAKICTCIDGGYYCNTCSERLMCCTCHRPEYRWKPKE